jgi:hypothetical protein
MKHVRVSGAVLAAALVLAARPTVAHAESRPSLRWNAPEACPDDASALQQVVAFLGQELQATPPQELAISAVLQGDAASGFSAKLVFRTPKGSSERYLDHPDCAKLTEAAALLVALAIDPERVRARQQAEQGPSASSAASEIEPALAPPAVRAVPEERPVAVPVSPDAREQSRRSPTGSPYRAMFALFGLGGAGSLPSWGGGVGGDVGLRRGPWRASVAGRYWGPRTESAENAPPAEVVLSLVTVGLRLCGLPLAGDWTFAACATADLGDLFGYGEGVQNSRTRHDRYSALGAAVNVTYSRWAVAPFAGLEVAGALDRPKFGVQRSGRDVEAFRPAAWSFAAFLGLAFER